jgi:hypothetical protein
MKYRSTRIAILICCVLAGFAGGWFLNDAMRNHRTDTLGVPTADRMDLDAAIGRHKVFNLHYGKVTVYKSADGRTETARVYSIHVSDSKVSYLLEYIDDSGHERYEKCYMDSKGLHIVQSIDEDKIEHRIRLPIVDGDRWTTYYPSWGRLHIDYVCENSQIYILNKTIDAVHIRGKVSQGPGDMADISYWYSMSDGLVQYNIGGRVSYIQP